MHNIIQLDQQLLLCINNMGCPAMDGPMLLLTKTLPWIPLHLFLLYILWRQFGWQQMLLLLLGVALVVLCADRFASGLCKPFFERLRPTHEPCLEGLVRIVDGYRGGQYGFISSHASNTFGVATFLTLCSRSKIVAALSFLWATVAVYTRMYLGVHYPGDILCGAIAGIIIAYIIYKLYTYVCLRSGRPAQGNHASSH